MNIYKDVVRKGKYIYMCIYVYMFKRKREILPGLYGSELKTRMKL